MQERVLRWIAPPLKPSLDGRTYRNEHGGWGARAAMDGVVKPIGNGATAGRGELFEEAAGIVRVGLTFALRVGYYVVHSFHCAMCRAWRLSTAPQAANLGRCCVC